MANVLLGVTGSVAAVRTPDLFRLLQQHGHAVRVVATQASLYFFDSAALDRTHAERNPYLVSLDEDEWPGRGEGKRYQRDDPVLHIELRRWAELLLIAPLDANTLAKLATGLCDNCLTCVWRAWDVTRPVILAPAMNTLMWEHPLTARHLATVAGMAAEGDVTGLIARINRECPRLRVVLPASKRLACGDMGVGALANLDDVAAAVTEMLRSSG